MPYLFERSTRTLCPGGIPPRENHRNGRCPGCRRPDRPYPHPVRRRPTRRIVRQTDRNGDHRLRPHRHGVLSATRHRSSDRRRMQCTGRTAIRRCSTGPPLTSTGLGTCRQNPRNRRCRTRRVARRGLRPDVGIPRRGMRSPPRRARARRIPAARRGGVPGRHPHLPHSAGRYDPAHGRGEALRANEARQHPHQHFARRGSRWAGAPRKRFAIRPRRLGTRARSRPATAAGRIARHPSYRRLFRPGQGQCNGPVRPDDRPVLRTVARGVVSVKHRPVPSPGDLLAGALRHDRRPLRHRRRKQTAEREPRKFETIRNEYRYREEYF